MKMSNNPAKYEVISKQYLRSILDISEIMQVLSKWTILTIASNFTIKHVK